MKRLILASLIILSSLLFVIADSDSHEDFSEAIEILEQKIPYTQITDAQFEILGDYFMELMLEEDHEYIDEMMGGEGSESLRIAHINMGKRFYSHYLQAGILPTRGMGPSMMGSSEMMGTNDWGHMMYPGDGHFFWGFGVVGFGIVALVAILLIVLIFLLAQKKGPEKEMEDNTIKLLKERYAKGEITKAEFDKTRKDLES